jgi:hypothetical protein
MIKGATIEGVNDGSQTFGLTSDGYLTASEATMTDLIVSTSFTTEDTCTVDIDGFVGIGIEHDEEYDLKIAGDANF